MATSKKSAAKTARKSSTTKVSAKRAPSKPIVKTSVKHAAHTSPRHKTFRVTRQPEPFFTFRINHQTIYWLVLSLIVLLLGLWVISINDKVQRIYDEIDRTNAADQSTVLPYTSDVR